MNPLSTGLGTVLILNLLFTFTIPEISKGGHIGGLIGGAIAGWVVLAPNYKSVPQWATYVAPVAVMAASVIVSVAIVG